MRVLVFFDLPVVTGENKKEYRRFRKYLLKNGFLMLQESVYCKLALNGTAVKTIVDGIHKNKPDEGLIQTDRQVDQLIKEAAYQEVQILLIENVMRDCVNGGKRCIIDSDKCEI